MRQVPRRETRRVEPRRRCAFTLCVPSAHAGVPQLRFGRRRRLGVARLALHHLQTGLGLQRKTDVRRPSLNQTPDLFQLCFLHKRVRLQQGPGSGAGPHPVQVSLDAVVQDLGGQLGLGQLRPQEGGLHTHTLHTLLPAQVPAKRRTGSIVNARSLWFHKRSHSGSIKPGLKSGLSLP